MSYNSQIHTIERDLSGVLYTIRGIRNIYVPVNKLPTEILSRALEYRTSEQDLIAATQVCQHWRSALIFSPSLWSCFQFRSSPNHDRTLVYLERSKSAPIDIRIINELLDLKEFGYLTSNIARTRSLSIHAGHGIRPALLHLCDPAPCLQHLEICTFGGVVSLPANFLAQQAPSLRSINLTFARPAFDHFFPLPNLTEFNIYIPQGAKPVCMGALLRFLSAPPLLHRIRISIFNQTIQDISPYQVTPLDSLVEMNYSCNPTNSILPFPRLPCLKKLRVTSTVGPGQMQKLVDVLPCRGRTLLARTTRISCYSDRHTPVSVDLFGNGADISFNALCNTANPAAARLVDWFSDQTIIPFGQVEELRAGRFPAPGFPIDAFALENIRILRVASLRDEQSAEVFLRLFHPEPCAGVPCRSLREIECTCWGTGGPLPRPFISLVRERKRAGYQLEFFCLSVAQESDRDLLGELREHVGEVRVRVRDKREPLLFWQLGL